MKKCVFFAALACVLAACSSDNGEEPSVLINKAEVTLTFSPYEMTAERVIAVIS